MQWLALAVVLLGACGDDPDPVTDPALHRIVPCEPEWSAIFPEGFEFDRCETACATPPSNFDPGGGGSGGLACVAQRSWDRGPSQECYQSQIFEYGLDAVRGCCGLAGAGTGESDLVYFAVCVDGS